MSQKGDEDGPRLLIFGHLTPEQLRERRRRRARPPPDPPAAAAPPDPPRKPPGEPRPPIAADVVEVIVQSRKSGSTISWIALRTNLHKSTVWNILRRNGVK